MVPSALPLASVRPSGLNATESTAAVLPVRGWPSGLGRAGSATSHSRTVPSRLPLASVCPSGLNATESTAPTPLVRGWPSGRGCAGSATSHSRTMPSQLPLASVRPAGLNATEYDGGVSPPVERLAERAGVRGIGDVPQPDRAVGVAAGQRVPVGAERHGLDGRTAGQGLAERAGVRADRRRPTAGWCRRRCRWPACARRG